MNKINGSDPFDNDPLELEFSNLPPEEGKHTRPLMLTSQLPTKSGILRLSVAVSSVILAMLVIFGTFPALRDKTLALILGSIRVAPTATAQNSTVTFKSILIINTTPGQGIFWSDGTPASISNTLGTAPGNCPSTPGAQLSHPTESSTIPMWLARPDNTNLSHHLYNMSAPGIRSLFTPIVRTSYGWLIQTLLLVKTDYTGSLEFIGGHVENATPLLLALNTDQQPGTTLTLDPQLTASTAYQYETGFWRAWTMNIYVPVAGCYYVIGSWPGGLWQANFAAGI